jgi:hypothetical protein
MSYHYPRVRIKARFPNIQPIDWKAYEDRKISALKDKSKPSRREDKLLAQRDTLFYVLSKKFGLSTRKIEGELKNMGLGEKDISPQSISDGIRKIAEEERQKKEMVGGNVV